MQNLEPLAKLKQTTDTQLRNDQREFRYTSPTTQSIESSLLGGFCEVSVYA